MAIVTIKRRTVGKGVKGISSLLPGPNQVKVGFPSGEADADNIQKAIWNEFGTSQGIPERPFMRNAMRNNRSSYQTALAKSAASIIKQAALGKTVSDEKRKMLAKLGIKAQGDIQAEITSLRTPPNAPSTMRQKRSSNPLINSGEMRAAVTFKVEDK